MDAYVKITSAFIICTLLVTPLSHVTASSPKAGVIVNGKEVKKQKIEQKIDVLVQKVKKKQEKADKDKLSENEIRKRVRGQVVDNTVKKLVLKTKAQESNITVSEQEINRTLDRYRQRAGGDTQLQQAINKQNGTMGKLRSDLKKRLRVKKFLRQKIGKITVSDSDVRQFYNQNKTKLKGKSFAKIRPRLRQLIKRKKQSKAQGKVLDQLRDESNIEINV